MKHAKPRDFWSMLLPRKDRALRYEREQRLGKIKECMALKAENEKLWDLASKQRMALDAMQKGHAHDMAEMTESLRRVHAQLAAVEAERDRYRDALRRAFPREVSA